VTAGPVGKHSAPRGSGWARHRALLIVGSTVVVVGLAGGVIAFAATRGPSAAEKQAHAAAVAQARAAAEEAVVHTNQTHLLDSLQISPAPGAAGVALDSLVKVTVTSGTVASVKVVAASGSALAGAVSPTTGAWVSTGTLLPSTTYTVAVAVTGDGVTATRSATFSTLTPLVTVTADVFPTEGMTVGVGQPLVLHFNHSISSPAVRQAIESRVTVAMTTPVPGGWYWFSDYELHFRPQGFWPAHETIRVTADLNGVDVGNGEWTSGSILDTFAIGDARISYANLASEVMTVTVDGSTAYTFPISGGRPQYPTMNGVHLVLDRASVVHMVSSTVGIPVKSPNGYDEYVYDDVHISDSGEYVHAAPWSVASQGVTNVSHGCINLSPINALTYFDLSRVGDVVEVTGSPRSPVWGDHGVMDWSGPAWSEWAPAAVVALPAAAAPTSTPTTATAAATHQAAPTTVAPVTVAPTTVARTTVAPTTTRPVVTTKPTPATTRPAVTTTTTKRA
jgi:lipoprotein-anchoring transpeptidase ErfK/SrfK